MTASSRSCSGSTGRCRSFRPTTTRARRSPRSPRSGRRTRASSGGSGRPSSSRCGRSAWRCPSTSPRRCARTARAGRRWPSSSTRPRAASPSCRWRRCGERIAAGARDLVIVDVRGARRLRRRTRPRRASPRPRAARTPGRQGAARPDGAHPHLLRVRQDLDAGGRDAAHDGLHPRAGARWRDARLARGRLPPRESGGGSVTRDCRAGRRGHPLRFDSAPMNRVLRSTAARGAYQETAEDSYGHAAGRRLTS